VKAIAKIETGRVKNGKHKRDFLGKKTVVDHGQDGKKLMNLSGAKNI